MNTALILPTLAVVVSLASLRYTRSLWRQMRDDVTAIRTGQRSDG